MTEQTDSSKQFPKIIYVATYPTNGHTPDWVLDIEESYFVLHPAYNWFSEVGEKAIQLFSDKFGEKPPIGDKDKLLNWTLQVDLWAIQKSDAVVYDVDINPGYFILTTALLKEIPVVGVSEAFQNFPAHPFSAAIRAIVRPKEILPLLNMWV